MHKQIIHAGMEFGRLTVVDRVRVGPRWRWHCRCKCGTLKVLHPSALTQGYSRSCGCLRKETNTRRLTKHGESDNRLHQIWKNMRRRCRSPNSSGYKNYGARGITVCVEWEEFAVFRDWARSHGYEDHLTIDRIDNDLGYSPSNCHWATKMEQNANTRRVVNVLVFGEWVSLSEAGRRLGVSRSLLSKRVSSGGDRATVCNEFIRGSD